MKEILYYVTVSKETEAKGCVGVMTTDPFPRFTWKLESKIPSL